MSVLVHKDKNCKEGEKQKLATMRNNWIHFGHERWDALPEKYLKINIWSFGRLLMFLDEGDCAAGCRSHHLLGESIEIVCGVLLYEINILQISWIKDCTPWDSWNESSDPYCFKNLCPLVSCFFWQNDKHCSVCAMKQGSQLA